MFFPCYFVVARLPKRILCLSGCCVIFLLIFFLYLSRFPNVGSFLGVVVGTRRLHPELFKNETKPFLPELCSKRTEAVPKAAILVMSEQRNVAKRMTIRKGWAQVSMSRALGFLVLFVVDEFPGASTELRLESATFGDIIHTQFIHSRAELALRIVTGIQWVLDHCPKVSYIIKANDDVFINTFSLLTFLELIPTYKDENLNQRTGAKSSKLFEYLYRTKLEGSDYKRDLKYLYPMANAHLITSNNLNKESFDSNPHKDEHTKNNFVHNYPKSSTSRTLAVSPQKQHVFNKTIYCTIWRNITVTKPSRAWWSGHDMNLDYTVNPPYCAGLAYVIPAVASRLLVEAYFTDHSKDIMEWPGDFYFTSILADTAALVHSDLSTRYVFDINKVKDTVNDQILFVRIGNNSLVLSTVLWKLVAQLENEGTIDIIN